MEQEPAIFHSITVKLTSVGRNNIITLPEKVECKYGMITLKSQTVQFDASGCETPEVNVNIHGVNHITNINNSHDHIIIPCQMGQRTTHCEPNIILSVSNNRMERVLRYDILDENNLTVFGGSVPTAVYLTFQYQSPY